MLTKLRSTEYNDVGAIVVPDVLTPARSARSAKSPTDSSSAPEG